MMPRSDGIILGGIAQRGVWALDVDEEERKRIVEGQIELFRSMRAPSSRMAQRTSSAQEKGSSMVTPAIV
jgi:hypothetical protein